MTDWRTNTERWLNSEQEGRDEAADAAFTQLCAALPSVEPSSDFVHRAVQAAWTARARRRRMAVVAIAASVIAAAVTGVSLYVVFDVAGVRLLTTVASLGATAMMSTLSAATGVLGWWSAAARAGGAVSGVIAMPQTVAMLVAVELLGAAALYALHRVLRGGITFRNPRTFCF